MRRAARDVMTGHYFDYAKKKRSLETFTKAIKLEQELKPNDAKKKNLMLAIKHIETVQIQPNEIFSFWHVVGCPSKKRGYVKSRSLVNGQIEASLGGGLCQLSGLIYYVSLLANLEIIERHSHSLDIYTDDTRFAPLGSDATVAYGYKDLKIRNNLKSPIQYTFSITENQITISLRHTTTLKKNTVEFKPTKIDDSTTEVTTTINQVLTTKSIYKRQLPN